MIPADLDFAAAGAATAPAALDPLVMFATVEQCKADRRSRYVARRADGDHLIVAFGPAALATATADGAIVVATVHHGRPRPAQPYDRGALHFTMPEQTRAELDAHQEMIRATYAAEGARNALLRSKGHRLIVAGYEYFTDDRRDGDLYSAPDGRPLDADGYRNGGRFVCSARMADYMIAAEVATQEAITQADTTNTPRYVWRIGGHDDPRAARFVVAATEEAPAPLATRYTRILPLTRP